MLVVGEVDRTRQKLHRFVELVPPAGEAARASEPDDSPRAQPCELVFGARPDQVRVLGSHRLGVVVCEQGRMLVLCRAAPLEPVGERGVETAAPSLGDARVRDLASERVLDRELVLAGQRRARRDCG